MNKVLEFVAVARKFCVALVAALGVLATALSDGNLSVAEIVQVVLAFAGALGVYVFSNKQ